MKDAAREAIATKAGTITLSGLAAIWDNQPRKPDADAWGRWSIVWGESVPATIGTTAERTQGILKLQVFIREGQGSKAAHAAADAVGSALRHYTTAITTGAGAGRIQFELTSGPTKVGPSDAFEQWHISAPFRVDFYPTA